MLIPWFCLFAALSYSSLFESSEHGVSVEILEEALHERQPYLRQLIEKMNLRAGDCQYVYDLLSHYQVSTAIKRCILQRFLECTRPFPNLSHLLVLISDNEEEFLDLLETIPEEYGVEPCDFVMRDLLTSGFSTDAIKKFMQRFPDARIGRDEFIQLVQREDISDQLVLHIARNLNARLKHVLKELVSEDLLSEHLLFLLLEI